MIDNALKAGQDKNVGHEYAKDVESRYREDERHPIATPWAKINELLQGGLGGGDFGLIFGNPGGGKSWSLVALGGFAVSLGYNVLHYTLELGESYVGKRYDAFFTNISVNIIDKHQEKIKEAIETLKGQLIIKEFPTGQATIHTVKSHIQKCEGQGFKPDLIIIDYVDLMGTKKKTSDRKGEIDDIYISTKGLARELNLPIWSVSQVNRAGANDEIIEGDKAAGSYDKIMITDVAMSLSRKRKDKVDGTGRFHIMKNRYGMDGMTFNVKADTSTGHFEVSDHIEIYEETNPLTQPVTEAKDYMDRKELRNKFFELNQ
jgi:replicative DNA helicase